MLTEEIETQCWVKSDGQIEVLTKTWILRDGVREASSNERHVIDVGDDTTLEDQLIIDVATGVHTTARIDSRAIDKAAVELLALLEI